MCAKSFHLYPTLWDPMNCSLPGSTVHGILQVRMLEMGEMGGRFKMEGLYVYLWLIHVEV